GRSGREFGGQEREELERVLVGAAGCGLVDRYSLAVAELEDFVGERDRPCLRVAECLGLGAAAPDVIPLPEPGELGAVLGELVDQLREAGRLGAGGGDCAQVRRGGGGGMRPVGEQVPRGRVQERVPGGVTAGRW